MRTLLLQLADSGFPAGTFAHSGGLEALHQLGLLEGEAQLRGRMVELLWHTAHGALPFLNDAHRGDPVQADLAAQIFLSNHVAQRASQAQGKAFLLAAEATFESTEVSALREALPHSHLAVAFGAALATQSIPLDEARQAFLFCSGRAALSAVVRLGVLGPLRAQAVLHGLHGAMEEALAKTATLSAVDAVSVSPWLETAQSAHDRLYSRLFQS
jgi:urease accessory protein